MNLSEKLVPSKNLRIALIDEIYANRSDNEELYGLNKEYEKFQSKHGGPLIEELGEEAEYNPTVEKFILQLPITKEDLESIEEITFTADREAYAIIFPYWFDLDGDELTIKDLSGIEQCANLKNIDFESMVEDASLKPLIELKKIKEIKIDCLYNYKDIDSLLKLKLNKIRIGNLASADNKKEWEKIIDKLKKNKVEVEV